MNVRKLCLANIQHEDFDATLFVYKKFKLLSTLNAPIIFYNLLMLYHTRLNALGSRFNEISI